MNSTIVERDFATPPDFERGDEIALQCKATGKVHRGLFDDFHGGILFVRHVKENMIRSRALIDFEIIPACAA